MRQMWPAMAFPSRREEWDLIVSTEATNWATSHEVVCESRASGGVVSKGIGVGRVFCVMDSSARNRSFIVA